jgi:hypothetical protein
MDDLPNADERVKEDHKLDEENQREAERLARVRPARKSSMSIPPESPITPTTPSFSQWGAPPPLPAHAFGPNGSGTPSIFDMPSSTGEMALGDLIHLDDEPGFFDENISIPQSLDHGSLSGLSSSVLQESALILPIQRRSSSRPDHLFSAMARICKKVLLQLLALILVHYGGAKPLPRLPQPACLHLYSAPRHDHCNMMGHRWKWTWETTTMRSTCSCVTTTTE